MAHYFTHLRILSLCCALVLTISGCSNYTEPDVSPIFHTQIKDDDSKLFHFYLLITDHNGYKPNEKNKSGERSPQGERGEKGDKQGRGGQGDKQAKGGKGDKAGGKGNDRGTERNKRSANGGGSSQDFLDVERNEHLSELLLDYLATTFEENEYCRQGYMIIEERFGRGILSVKGECYDSATESDRKKFPKQTEIQFN